MQELVLENPLSLPADEYRYRLSTPVAFPYQRMVILYKGDTMILDCIGVPEQNPAQYTQYFDSLVFRKGYSRVMANQYLAGRRKLYTETEWSLFCSGPTPHTIAMLAGFDCVRYMKMPDASLMRTDNFAATYYLRRGERLLYRQQPDSALPDILRAVGMGLKNPERAEAFLMLCDAYERMGKYDTAIATITELIDSNGQDRNLLEICYTMRISLFAAIGKFDDALADHDTLISMAAGKGPPIFQEVGILQKARFKIETMSDCSGAVTDLLRVVENIPPTHLADRPEGQSDYAAFFFALGSAYHCEQDYPSAFRYWLKAMEFGMGNNNLPYLVRYFDSLIVLHPHVPELFLSRALAYSAKAFMSGRGKRTKGLLNNALDDFERAEDAGMKDFRINLFRARALLLLKKYKEALKQIDKGIAKNAEDPRLFAIRYAIRWELKLAKPGDHTDPDFVEYNRLRLSWDFGKK